MNTQNLKKAYFILLILEIFLLVLLALTPVTNTHFESILEDVMTIDVIFSFFFIVFVNSFLCLTSLVGLFLYKNWARVFYLIAFVINLAVLFSFTTMYGYPIALPELLPFVVPGVLLYLVFFTPLSKEFSKK